MDPTRLQSPERGRGGGKEGAGEGGERREETVGGSAEARTARLGRCRNGVGACVGA